MRLAVTLVAIVAGCSLCSAQRMTKVYVAEFQSIRSVARDLLTSFTNEFEMILIQSRAYDVFERRNLDRLADHARNEMRATSVRDLDAPIANLLKRQGADGVFFGEVDDDVESGETVIYVTLQRFDSKIEWKGSTSLKRSLRYDRETRIDALRKLVNAIRGTPLPRDQTGASSEQTPSITKSSIKEYNEVQLQVIEAVGRGNSLTVNLIALNKGADRLLSLYQWGVRTQAIVDGGNTYDAASIVIGNQEWRAELINGNPTPIRVTFQNLETLAGVLKPNTILRLRLQIPGEGLPSPRIPPGTIEFADIAIRKETR